MSVFVLSHSGGPARARPRGARPDYSLECTAPVFSVVSLATLPLVGAVYVLPHVCPNPQAGSHGAPHVLAAQVPARIARPEGVQYMIRYRIGISISDIHMGYRYGICYIDMVIHHIDMVILDIDMGYGISIWEMTVLALSSWMSVWDILSLWQGLAPRSRTACSCWLRRCTQYTRRIRPHGLAARALTLCSSCTVYPYILAASSSRPGHSLLFPLN